jgi:hypothetical protein
VCRNGFLQPEYVLVGLSGVAGFYKGTEMVVFFFPQGCQTGDFS